MAQVVDLDAVVGRVDRKQQATVGKRDLELGTEQVDAVGLDDLDRGDTTKRDTTAHRMFLIVQKSEGLCGVTQALIVGINDRYLVVGAVIYVIYTALNERAIDIVEIVALGDDVRFLDVVVAKDVFLVHARLFCRFFGDDIRTFGSVIQDVGINDRADYDPYKGRNKGRRHDNGKSQPGLRAGQTLVCV